VLNASTRCAGFEFPLATAPESIAKRMGKYHSEPSASSTPMPDSIVANRAIGVRAPAPFQP
jgi:hypothetical protein